MESFVFEQWAILQLGYLSVGVRMSMGTWLQVGVRMFPRSGNEECGFVTVSNRNNLEHEGGHASCQSLQLAGTLPGNVDSVWQIAWGQWFLALNDMLLTGIPWAPQTIPNAYLQIPPLVWRFPTSRCHTIAAGPDSADSAGPHLSRTNLAPNRAAQLRPDRRDALKNYAAIEENQVAQNLAPNRRRPTIDAHLGVRLTVLFKWAGCCDKIWAYSIWQSKLMSLSSFKKLSVGPVSLNTIFLFSSSHNKKTFPCYLLWEDKRFSFVAIKLFLESKLTEIGSLPKRT